MNTTQFWTFRRLSAMMVGVLIGGMVGCTSVPSWTQFQLPLTPQFSELSWPWSGNAVPNSAQNPIFVPNYDHERLWEIVVDAVDSHFPQIAREMPIRLFDGVLTEGRLDTKPVISASLFEPWHRNAIGFRDRLESTMQTIQKRAEVRVTPEQGGFYISVFVYKELEHKKQPLRATASVANLRFEEDMDSFEMQIEADTSTSGWILIGRDSAMEKQLLREIQYRLKRPPRVLKKSRESLQG